ncbi:GvpL/GvpF family gas vesicle protein [Streptomyces sp. NPDC006283]|uniref:GvpL/GvpF family gas vesicle protein n=1 Tax=Streptomyces sp. NPDC006283 TaxID=3156741 RepID=UPI0033BE643A
MTQLAADGRAATATYVFAVCRDADPAVLAHLPGLAPQAPVRSLACGTLTAIVQHVDAADFSDDVWQQRLSDRHELERCARAHHDVVCAAATCGPTVPLPLATMYRSDSRARQAVTEEADRFHAALERVARHQEWGVKVYAPTVTTEADDSPRPTAPAGRVPPAPGAGLAYLNRRRDLQQRRERHREETLQTAEAVDAELRTVATAARRLRLHSVELTAPRGTQVLNAAYLVATHRSDDFARLVRTLGHRAGARIEVSGPWVPYSFVGEA